MDIIKNSLSKFSGHWGDGADAISESSIFPERS
jgi:hypothetical protein